MSTWTIAQGFIQIFPLLPFLWHMAPEVQAAYGRLWRTTLLVLIPASLLFFVLNFVRVFGIFRCSSHVFNFTLMGCLPREDIEPIIISISRECFLGGGAGLSSVLLQGVIR